ncbi:MAG: metal ABC transporter ATP-binding protein [Pseudomonadota bacterium]
MLQSSPHLASLSNAGVYRAGRWLIRGVDLALQRREIVTLIGPNGSGKSTTVKLLLGILKPDEGEVNRIKGLTVSYVPQKVTIDWTLPLHVKRFMSLTGGASARDIDAAMEATGVNHLAGAEVRTLSGGEFQRVLLARAIARKPDLLVLDEPVQGVDFKGEIALYDLIGTIRDDLGCGIVLVSHDLHVVMAATDRVLCLNGRVCCSGTPTTVASSPEYKALFGARAASNLAIYEHQNDHTDLPDGRVQNPNDSITENRRPADEHGNEIASKDEDGNRV